MKVKPIELIIIRYDIDTLTKAGKVQYQAIEEACKALKHRKFDAIGEVSELNNIPDSVTVETDHLFDNQFNTVEGCRVFDWRELSQYGRIGRGRKVGYYITGDVEALKAARDNQLVCGYCGRKYDKDTAPAFCNGCLGSEYLEESKLKLLVLRPVSKPRFDVEKCDPVKYAEIKKAFELEKPKMLARMEAERIARLNKQADKLEAETLAKIEELKSETTIQCLLMRAGIDRFDTIHYSHNDEWVFGWNKPLSEDKRQDYIKRLRSIENELPELFIESITWKMVKAA